MGHIFAEIRLSNPRQPSRPALSVRALADTGALMLCLPQAMAAELELETETMREVTVADGRSMKVPYAGPIPNIPHARVKGIHNRNVAL